MKYYYDIKSRDNLQQLVRHLRNAIAHSNITTKCKNSNEISHVIFEDRNGSKKFSIELDVGLLEYFLDVFSKAAVEVCS